MGRHAIELRLKYLRDMLEHSENKVKQIQREIKELEEMIDSVPEVIA